MGFLVYNMINPIYGKRAANSVSAFADMYAGNDTFRFVSRFKKIADAAKPKFIWSAMQDVNSQIKANMVAILGAQFKSPEHAHMPQSASLSILQSLDGFCIAKTPKKAVNDFLNYWEKVANPKYRMSDADICDFANTIRILRQQVMSFIMSNPDAKAIQQCQMLQSQLCYIEAGFYRVSQLKLVEDRYVSGPRTSPRRINPLQQGYFVFEQPAATSESRLENKARELKHDVLVSGLFAMEEQAFAELDCHPSEGCKQDGFLTEEAFISSRCVSDLSNNEVYYCNQFKEALEKLSDLNRQYLADYLPAAIEVSSLANSSDGFSERKTLSEDSLALNFDRQDDVSLQSTPDSEASSEDYLQTPVSGDVGAVLEGSSPESVLRVKDSGGVMLRMRSAVVKTLNFIKGLTMSAQAVVPQVMSEHALESTLDDTITNLERGIDRIAAHESLTSNNAVSKADLGALRHSLKKRLQYYLSCEESLLDTNSEIDSSALCRLGFLNHRAEDVLKLFKNTSQSPRWNALKKCWRGRSYQGALQQKLADLLGRVQDSQRATIIQCFQDKINPDDLAISLSWLKRDYGLDQCHDEQKLYDFLAHLRQIDGRLSFVDMQKYCREFALMIVDDKSFNPKS